MGIEKGNSTGQFIVVKTTVKGVYLK